MVLNGVIKIDALRPGVRSAGFVVLAQ